MTRPSQRSVPWLVNRARSVDGPSGISLPARRALGTRCSEQMFREAWMRDGGSRTGHELCVPFSPGLALICFSGFDPPRPGWTLCQRRECHAGLQARPASVRPRPVTRCVPSSSSHRCTSALCTYKIPLPHTLKGSILSMVPHRAQVWV